MRIVSDKLLEIPYVHRNKEEDFLISQLTDFSLNRSIRQLQIIGKSGTGKTALVKKVIENILKNDSDKFVLYNDLSHDDFTNNLFLETLIGDAFVPKKFNSRDASNIPKGKSFKSFIEKKDLKKEAKNKIYEALVQSLSFIPTVGSYIEKILPKTFAVSNDMKYDTDFRLIFYEYFEFLTNDNQVLIILDNYQFLPQNLRHKLESTLRNLKENLMLITIIRTKDDEDNIVQYKKYKVLENSEGLILNELEYEAIQVLFEQCFPKFNKGEIDKVVMDCLNRTEGNLKEVEQYVFALKSNQLGYSESSSLTSVNSMVTERLQFLNRIQTDILMLASLFPNGLKLEYVKDILYKNHLLPNNTEFIDHIQLLISYNLIYLNGHEKDLLKPSHEKIINAIKNNIQEEEFLEVRQSCIETFTTILEKANNQTEYAYLISNLIGILKSHEIKINIKYFIQLVRILFLTSNFHQILDLFERIILREPDSNILSFLPDHIIEFFFETFQKTSNFELGLYVIKLIKSNFYNSEPRLDTDFYEAKYLVQLYKYKEANEIIKGKTEIPKYKYLQLNILQHQRNDKQAKEYIEELQRNISSSDIGEYYYIILRNSGHLFSSKIATRNIQLSAQYFRDKSNIFAYSTCLNNLGLIKLYSGEESEGYSIFKKAETTFAQLLSNEIYQPRFNLGLTCFMLGDHKAAAGYYDLAFKNLPSSLDYDRVKFTSNKMLNAFLLNELSHNELIEFYDSAINSSGHIPDPWLIFMLRYNKGAFMSLNNTVKGSDLQEKAKEDYIGDPSIYGIDFSIKDFQINVMLATSPHWRY